MTVGVAGQALTHVACKSFTFTFTFTCTTVHVDATTTSHLHDRGCEPGQKE